MSGLKKLSGSNLLKSARNYIYPLLLFILIVLYLFHDILLLKQGKYIISYFLDDPFLNMAILKHNMDLILSHNLSGLWHLNIFYPYKYTLAFSENLLPQSLILIPIYKLSGYNIVVTYNWAILLSFIALAFTSYIMFYYHTKNVEASLLSSVFFAFSPFFLTHINHFQVLTGIWMPLMFLTIHLALEKNDVKYTVLSSFFYVIQSASCMYYMVILPIFVIIYLLVYYHYYRKNICLYLKTLFAFIFFSLIPVILLSLPYIEAKSLYGFKRTIQDTIDNMPAFLNFILPTPCTLLDKFIKSIVTNNIPLYTTTRLYMGILPSLVILLAVIFIEKDLLIIFRFKRHTHQHPDEYIPVFTVKTHKYPPFIKALWWSFWISLLLTMGPKILGSLLPNPVYILFYKLYPGACGIRDSKRFFVITLLSSAMFIAYFYDIYLKDTKKHTPFVISLLIILIEFLPKNAPIRRMPYNGEIPRVYQWISQNTAKSDKIVEFPLCEVFYMDSIYCKKPDQPDNRKGQFYTFYSAFHKRDIFNGYSGYFSPLYIYALITPPQTQIEIAKSIGIKYLVIHKDIYHDIEQVAKNKIEDPDIRHAINLQNHRAELINGLEDINAHKVYEDSIAEIYELEEFNQNFDPEKARLSYCKTSISATLDRGILNIQVSNKGKNPCILLYKEKLRVKITKDDKVLINKKIVLNPGSYPPFIPINGSFNIPIRLNPSSISAPVNIILYTRTNHKSWKKLGESILK